MLSYRAGPQIVAAAVILSVCFLPAGAAPTLDLTTLGSSGTINGAYFEQVDASSTGTGIIDSFVRMGANTSIERGYNTDGVVQFDTKDDTHTHSLLLSSVPIVMKNGVLYREFLLDINESGGTKSTLSLDTIEIYLAGAGNLTGYPSLGTKIFDLDSGGDAWILLKASLNSGSGSGDMFAYIPNTLFSGGTQVYLYSKFGESESSIYPNDGGFEEWAVRVGVAPPQGTPAPGAFLLTLLGSNVTIWLHRRRRS
jgi:hypothetical protein